jgi:hypothetical protein
MIIGECLEYTQKFKEEIWCPCGSLFPYLRICRLCRAFFYLYIYIKARAVRARIHTHTYVSYIDTYMHTYTHTHIPSREAARLPLRRRLPRSRRRASRPHKRHMAARTWVHSWSLKVSHVRSSSTYELERGLWRVQELLSHLQSCYLSIHFEL